jgi:hypothetical protein
LKINQKPMIALVRMAGGALKMASFALVPIADIAPMRAGDAADGKSGDHH